MKKITLQLSIPITGYSHGKDFTLELDDDATIIDALAAVDKYIIEHPDESIFPLYDGYIHHYLQLFIDLEEEKFYDDVGISPYAPDDQGLLRKFNPIKEDIYFPLYPDSVINLQVDVGC
ncbi:MAG: hypothetical protein ACTSVV_00985 [Promethearchaeota archaeon]